jgi:hypothetical protein
MPAMRQPDVPQELIDHLVRSRGLAPSDALGVVHEISAYFAESTEDFIVRRHRELQADGLRNPTIYALIGDELATRLFRASRLSERQIRRIVYG